MRLFDERRSKIKIGDFIEFINKEVNETILCKVSNLYQYSTFEELYKNHNKISLGYEENEKASFEDMYIYYSKEKIDLYGVVGIEIEIIE